MKKGAHPARHGGTSWIINKCVDVPLNIHTIWGITPQFINLLDVSNIPRLMVTTSTYVLSTCEWHSFILINIALWFYTMWSCYFFLCTWIGQFWMLGGLSDCRAVWCGTIQGDDPWKRDDPILIGCPYIHEASLTPYIRYKESNFSGKRGFAPYLWWWSTLTGAFFWTLPHVHLYEKEELSPSLLECSYHWTVLLQTTLLLFHFLLCFTVVFSSSIAYYYFLHKIYFGCCILFISSAALIFWWFCPYLSFPQSSFFIFSLENMFTLLIPCLGCNLWLSYLTT